MIRNFGIAIAAMSLLSACGVQDVPPSVDKVEKAMSPFYSNPIDTIQGLSCSRTGTGRYLCDFTISVIGLFPERRTECLQLSMSGWAAVDDRVCRD